MLKRFVAALMLLALGNTAIAQSFPKPPDVPAYVAQPVTYEAGSTPNVDNSGTPPAYAYEATDIPTSQTGRIITGSYPDAESGFCTIYALGGTEPTCQEAKIRTHVNATHILFDDPIRNYGQPGQSHCHEFFGNPTVNAYSTYASVRSAKWSAAAGDMLNGTGYWFPCPIKANPFGDGSNYVVRMDYALLYYQEDPIPLKHLIRGLRYVLGTEMDDPDDSLVKREIYLANAQPGTAGRYSFSGNGFAGWVCATGDGSVSPITRADGSGSTRSLTLKKADGSDPWGGACVAGSVIYPEFNAPQCWDGVNLWSPGGYKHFRYTIHDNVLGKDVCPKGWYRVPRLQGKLLMTTSGPSDYMNWRLSSDDMMAAKLNSLPLCASDYSNAPCSETAPGSRVALNGQSFHTDWFGAWDGTVFTLWQQQCLGVDGNVPHQCFDSIMSQAKKLIVTETGPKRAPQVDLFTHYGTSSASKMFKVQTTSKGPKTLHVH